jgi:SAM-dependent methyltransferase
MLFRVFLLRTELIDILHKKKNGLMQGSNQKTYWNKVAPTKNFTTTLDFTLIPDFIKKNSLIVDYGCGYGRTLNELYTQGYRNLLGFDFSEEMVERGRSEFPYLDLKTSKDNKIDGESGTVDMVILFAVLTCITEDEKQEALIREMKRVLKPNGLIYINDFLVNTDERNIQRYDQYVEKYGTYGIFALPEGAVLRHHEESHVLQLTKDFITETYQTLQFKTMNGHVSNGFVYIGRKK